MWPNPTGAEKPVIEKGRQLNRSSVVGNGISVLATFRRKKINENGEFRADFPSATFRVRVRTCSEVAVTNFFREAT
jgi:hypothetical protein